MTLHDYSQGCWRMRALGKGQCIHLIFTPEIRGLVSSLKVTETPVSIEDVVAWLSVNSICSEIIQWQQLQNQVLADLYRCEANQILRQCSVPSEFSLSNFEGDWEQPFDIARTVAQVLIYFLPSQPHHKSVGKLTLFFYFARHRKSRHASCCSGPRNVERQCVGEQELLRHRSRSIGDEERANFGVVVLILQTSWQQQQQQQQHLEVSIAHVVAARPPRTPQPCFARPRSVSAALFPSVAHYTRSWSRAAQSS
jgi:hypothetical protein